MSINFSDVNLAPLAPELILVGGLLAMLVIELLVKRKHGIVAAVTGVVLLGIVAIASLSGDEKVGSYLFGAVVQDGTTVFFRLFFVVATAISVGIMVITFPKDGEPFFLMLSGVVGMCLLAGSNDLVLLFVAMELVSIPSYVLASYKKNDPRSGEASLKYVLYGALSSGIMIYGFSLLYGMTGTTNLANMTMFLSAHSHAGPVHLIAVVLVLAGIGYKIAMVPFHFWCPDVYEGSPTAVTAFFSVVPKAAGFAALFRLMPVLSTIKPIYGITAVGLFTLASAVTMTFGNLGAIWQNSVKRLLAYSSIAHAGYLLMGFAVMAAYPRGELNRDASEAIMFYLVVYLFMNLGAFLVVDIVERRYGGERMRNFRGLGKLNPIPALALAVFLFSLTGLPPLAGFIGKFYIFAALIKGKLFGLALIGAANTVVSLFYYVRIIRDMFLHDPVEGEAVVPETGFGKLAGVLIAVTVVPTLVLGVWWGPLAEWIKFRVG